MKKLVHLGAFTKATRDAINQNFLLAGLGTVGNVIYLAPAVGNDLTAEVNNPDLPYDTLAAAYAAAVTGKNDVIVLVADGGTTATARVDTAFTWAKSATHLIGLCAPALFSPRARIAPTSTTVGAAGNINYFTVSGSGNYFANVQIWAGFATGLANTIALTVSGSRNVFENCHIAGLADAVSAADAGSRCVKLTGGENLFSHCVIGIDTVTRSAANASVELASGAARNAFEDCVFPFMASAATPIGVKVAAAAGCDRSTYFRRCIFDNANKSSSTTLAALATLAANAGGKLVFDYCSRYDITDWGTDATSLALCFVNGSGTGGTAADDVGRGAVAVAS